MASNVNTSEYFLSGGLVCPYCNSGSIQGGFVDVTAGEAQQEMHCADCQSEWTDYYTLSAIRTRDGQILLSERRGKP